MKNYRVIKPDVEGLEVGSTVELTDKKAKALVNKVELVESEYDSPVTESEKEVVSEEIEDDDEIFEEEDDEEEELEVD